MNHCFEWDCDKVVFIVAVFESETCNPIRHLINSREYMHMYEYLHACGVGISLSLVAFIALMMSFTYLNIVSVQFLMTVFLN